ncbi:MAG: lipid-A-disaccharide synthase [Candidatus Omnitrophota bacterium]
MNLYSRKKIFIIAGEASGDMHGAALAKALKQLNPRVELFGMGGEKMKQAGVCLFFESTKLAVTGFIEVLKHLNEFKKIFELLRAKLSEVKPDAVILIDYPGFNLKFAPKVKELNIKLFYYISPQVWAWGKNRVKIIRRLVDKMLVVFKFEEDFYKQAGVNAQFVGHPLLDIAAEYKAVPTEKKGIKIALLPGSRENEIKYILPVMLKTSLLLQEKLKNAEFLLAASTTVKKETYQKIIEKHNVKNLRVLTDKFYDCLSACDFALVCSGTATLETALFQKPMAIIYKMSFLSYLIIRALIKIPFIGLVNIVSGKKIVPEFIQTGARPKAIADYALKILSNPSAKKQIEENLSEVRKKLGTPCASRRAAEVILGEMGK